MVTSINKKLTPANNGKHRTHKAFWAILCFICDSRYTGFPINYSLVCPHRAKIECLFKNAITCLQPSWWIRILRLTWVKHLPIIIRVVVLSKSLGTFPLSNSFQERIVPVNGSYDVAPNIHGKKSVLEIVFPRRMMIFVNGGSHVWIPFICCL